ncbi:MAG: DUF763 domain-containing protein [Candidatus Micrarchaeia archaeon]
MHVQTGTANLPLHNGKAPSWLFEKMIKLSGLIAEHIIDEYGSKEFLRRISDPFFFQALGCVVGFDWHSSGLTTTTCGALKEYTKEKDIGIHVAGGKGKASRKTLDEIEKSGVGNTERLKYASRIIAKIDNSAVQDGYQLYHHCIFFDDNGEYAVVQQGLKEDSGYARRYHWISEKIKDFVNEPHSGIAGNFECGVLDMTSKNNENVRNTSVDLINDNPIHLYKYFDRQKTLLEFCKEEEGDTLNMRKGHWIKGFDLTEKDKQILRRAYELQPSNYEELIMIEGIGPKKIRALALVSDLVYGAKITWRDPVKYSFAHGGKDGTPFPVDKKTYNTTISLLENALYGGGVEKLKTRECIRKLQNIIISN